MKQVTATRVFVMIIGFLVSLQLIASAAITGDTGHYHVELYSDSGEILTGKARLTLVITDSHGTAVSGAAVDTLVNMPGMNMGERTIRASELPTSPGIYEVSAAFAMEGKYNLHLQIARNGLSEAGDITIATGDTPGQYNGTAATGKASSWAGGFASAGKIAVCVGVLVLVSAVLRRIPWKRSKTSAFSALFFIASILTAFFVVQRFRRPGAMTPLEAQGMQMEMPAPEGTLPVSTVTAEKRRQSPTVELLGTIEGLNEQEITARVQGTILQLPHYVGQSVRPGDLLVKLDTAAAVPQTEAASSGVQITSQGVNVATREYEQTVAAIKEAHAEVGMKQGAVEEAEASVNSAQAEKAAAAAEYAAILAMRQDAAAGEDSAQSERDYWAAEVGRERALFARKAVTRDELQKEESQYQTALARMKQAQAKSKQVEAQILSAQAACNRTEASLVGAKARLKSAQSELASHYAHVASSQAMADSARQKIAQARASERQARAMYRSAVVTQSFSEIRALTPGVVSQRLVSEGMTVNPGQPILRVSDMSHVRVKAYAPESDLPQIRVGTPVKITFSSGKTTSAFITSTAGSVDPVSRTAPVEASIPAGPGYLIPGESAKISIATGSQAMLTWVPANSVLYRSIPDARSGKLTSHASIWLAISHKGQLVAHETNVVVGDTSGEFVAISSGVGEGDHVIVSGTQNLQEGIAIQERSSKP